MDVRPRSAPITIRDPIHVPYQAVPAYKPKKGGLASRATPTGPRTSTKALQSAKAAWSETSKSQTPATGRISKRELAAINASRKQTRNSLRDWMECEKRPDSKKAGKERQKPQAARGGKGSEYTFRKWC